MAFTASKKLLSLAMVTGMTLGTLGFVAPESAYADRCWRDKHGRKHCDNGRHYSRDGRYYYDDHRRSWFDTRTGKIVKGGLIGAGVGAGSAVLLDKSVGRSAVLGAGIGAGVQAIRYSDWLDRRR